MTVVSDSTPLIHLSALGDLNLLPELFGSILIPPAVHHEVVVEGWGKPGAAEVSAATGRWLVVSSPLDSRLTERMTREEELQVGETEAILLAEHSGATLLLDDQRAVACARGKGLEVVRTPALYVAAKRRGRIEEVRPKLDALRRSGFRLKGRDYEAILRFAGEI